MDSKEYGYFWNSVNHDREYNADSFAEWLSKFFTTGVFADELFISSTSGMTVKSAPGYANINGKVRFFETENQLTLSPANSTYPRIDTIVIERNDTNREITMHTVTGMYLGSSPVTPAPVRENNVYQIILAQIYVAPGVTEITQADITDARSDNSICGYITGTVESMDFSQFAAQFATYYSEFKAGSETDFNIWFQSMKDQLSTDAAGNLQTELDATNAVVATKANQNDVTDLQNTANTSAILTLASADWSASTTTLSGVAYYTLAVTLNHIYDDHPVLSVSGADSTVLPTETQQEMFDLIKYAYADRAALTITFYVVEKPTSDVYVLIKGGN